MQTEAHGIVPTPLSEVNVNALGNLVDRSLGRTIAVPASKKVVGDRSHSGGHECKDSRSWEARIRIELTRLTGQELREVFAEKQRPQSVDAEGGESLVGIDLRRALFRMQYAGYTKS